MVGTVTIKLFSAALALVALAGLARGDEKEKDREARAKAAITMTAPGVSAKSNVAPLPRVKAGEKLCTDATCTCPPGTKGTASAQLGKAIAEHRVVVVFYGGVPAKCCGGVLVGVDADVPAGVSEKTPIVVYAPAGTGAVSPIVSLARLATNEEITAAIRKAQAAAR